MTEFQICHVTLHQGFTPYLKVNSTCLCPLFLYIVESKSVSLNVFVDIFRNIINSEKQKWKIMTLSKLFSELDWCWGGESRVLSINDQAFSRKICFHLIFQEKIFIFFKNQDLIIFLVKNQNFFRISRLVSKNRGLSGFSRIGRHPKIICRTINERIYLTACHLKE